MEFRLRSQIENHRPAILGNLHALGDQAVLAEWLVGAIGHQALEQLADASGGLALDIEGIEGIETADGGQSRLATLGRVGIDIVEMPEIRPVLRLTVQGDPMRRRPGGEIHRQETGDHEQGGGPSPGKTDFCARHEYPLQLTKSTIRPKTMLKHHRSSLWAFSPANAP